MFCGAFGELWERPKFILAPESVQKLPKINILAPESVQKLLKIRILAPGSRDENHKIQKQFPNLKRTGNFHSTVQHPPTQRKVLGSSTVIKMRKVQTFFEHFLGPPFATCND